MFTYAISYEIPGATKDASSRCDRLADRIRSFFPTFCRPLDAMWIVRSDHSVSNVRDNLSPYLTDGDRLWVVRIGDACAWHGLAPEVGTWLRDNL